MFLIDDTIIYSASDLTLAATCEFATLRTLDFRLGRVPAVAAVDRMLERTAALGQAHEKRLVDDFRAQYGSTNPAGIGGVEEITLAPGRDLVALRAAWQATKDALASGVDVVVQGSFFDGRFHGRSDFLLKTEVGYQVLDAKLARHAKITALLQLAAYADQLQTAGIALNPEVGLILGDGSYSYHGVGDLLPVYRERRARLQRILDEHQSESAALAWDDPRYKACGRCDVCAEEVAAHDDLLQVAGLRTTQRTALRAVGIRTMQDLAATKAAVAGISSGSLSKLRAQATLQCAQQSKPFGENGQPQVSFEVFDTAALGALPAPDDGDIFFDFEGDPLWTDHGSTDWGLEYLFGVVECDGTFRPWWAHDRREEKQALVDFLGYVTDRRKAHPGLHIYHYAAYERTALLRLAGRHNVGEEAVDDLLRAGVLVDLYSTVRQSVRVSQPSYSIKKLEPLYMGADLRSEELDNAADSIVLYAEACDLREVGRVDDSDKVLATIADYNHYDCRSTLKLLGWLRDRAVEAGVSHPLTTLDAAPAVEPAVDMEAESLLALAGDALVGERTPDEQAYALLSASLGFHKREQKPFWWAHFSRLTDPVEDWVGAREVFVPEAVEVVEDWHLPPRKRSQRRRLRLTGELPDGSLVAQGSKWTAVYGTPLPNELVLNEGCVRGTAGSVEVLSISAGAGGRHILEVEEMAHKTVGPCDELLMALCPVAPLDTRSMETANREVATMVLQSDALPPQPAIDLMRRLPPRITDGLPPVIDGDAIAAITAATAGLDHSYLAVQGPPGTGKTYVGARVVQRLVALGWRIGVVAQSHSVVDNFLDEVVEAGVDPKLVGKKSEDPRPHPWTVLDPGDYESFLADHIDTGCVVGGTAWDFTNTGRVGRGQLDLLVIDEAGQFALANTLAVSVAAQRLLLLGDPQQLPQVSQGVHPEPVEESALGWLAHGHAALPADLGYFLARSWRMHPALCERVSVLSYAGQLQSQLPQTTERELVGLTAGVHRVLVDHQGRSVVSPEEADAVVDQVRALVGKSWLDPARSPDPKPLGQSGLLVVAAYNAQVELIRRALRMAGFGDVKVGTVDKLQGREAPVVIVSMAASSHEDVPRGMGFLLSRNRINVAVSRGQWATIIVRSTWLTDYLPTTPDNLAELGAFIGLTENLGTS